MIEDTELIVKDAAVLMSAGMSHVAEVMRVLVDLH